MRIKGFAGKKPNKANFAKSICKLSAVGPIVIIRLLKLVTKHINLSAARQPAKSIAHIVKGKVGKYGMLAQPD